MNMQNKGLSNISIIFFVFVFIIVWALFFAEQITTFGHLAVVNGDLSGVEALLYENLNTLIGVVLLIFVVAVVFGGG